MSPIDSQINGLPARSILKGFDNVKQQLRAEGASSLPAYMPLIEKYDLPLLAMGLILQSFLNNLLSNGC